MYVTSPSLMRKLELHPVVDQAQREKAIAGKARPHHGGHASASSFSCSPFTRRDLPRQIASSPVRRKQLMACSGVSTIGSFSLKLVFNTIGIPDNCPKQRMSS